MRNLAGDIPRFLFFPPDFENSFDGRRRFSKEFLGYVERFPPPRWELPPPRSGGTNPEKFTYVK